jgi:predicted anti-sigma-YlaC factor YlaD
MSCLRIADIYAYLEGAFAAGRREEIEKHLRLCPKCREAVADRKYFDEAASSLPDLDMPLDFTDRVMARIAAAPRTGRAWLAAAAAGISALALFLVLAAVVGGENLLTLLARLNHAFWGYAKDGTVLLAKLLAVLSLAGKVLNSLADLVYKGLGLLTALIGPGGQVLILTLMFAIFIALLYVLRRKSMTGEKA